MKNLMFIVALCISTLTLLLVGAVFDRSLIDNHDQLRQVERGFPLKYIRVGIGRYDPPYPWEDGQGLMKKPFSTSFFTVFIGQLLLLGFILDKNPNGVGSVRVSLSVADWLAMNLLNRRCSIFLEWKCAFDTVIGNEDPHTFKSHGFCDR